MSGETPEPTANSLTGRLDRHTPWEALPEFLTPTQFRAIVGIGKGTVYELLKRNEIPHVRFGRLYRIPKAVLQQLASSVK